MPNKKGGYKIVSLKNINLLGVSLNLAGLYKALNDSYGKPIQLCDIKFGTVAKKDAFVLVEKLDAGVKINDLYGYDILVESDDDITVTANPQELPATASATAGQILGLDAQKKPEWQDKPATLKLYKHLMKFGVIYIVFVTTSNTVSTMITGGGPSRLRVHGDIISYNEGNAAGGYNSASASKIGLQEYTGDHPEYHEYGNINKYLLAVSNEGVATLTTTELKENFESDTVTEL